MPELMICRTTMAVATKMLLPIYLANGASFQAAAKLPQSGTSGQSVGGECQISSLFFNALVTIQ
ncbi:hypothetical protein D3C80_1852130 [compost metagenome]